MIQIEKERISDGELKDALLQSLEGKTFKKVVGLSPSEYREKEFL